MVPLCSERATRSQRVIVGVGMQSNKASTCRSHAVGGDSDLPSETHVDSSGPRRFPLNGCSIHVSIAQDEYSLALPTQDHSLCRPKPISHCLLAPPLSPCLPGFTLPGNFTGGAYATERAEREPLKAGHGRSELALRLKTAQDEGLMEMVNIIILLTGTA